MRQIMNQLDAQTEELGRRIIVIHGEGWHHGVVGIVASRMVERFGKPCIVFQLKGMWRAVPRHGIRLFNY